MGPGDLLCCWLTEVGCICEAACSLRLSAGVGHRMEISQLSSLAWKASHKGLNNLLAVMGHAGTSAEDHARGPQRRSHQGL